MSGLPRRPWPSIRPGAIVYSRRIRLPSTTPQPATLNAGSICSALVSASFMKFLKQESWQDAESAIASGAIHGKIPAVEGEDGVDAFAASQINQRGVGQLRTDVLVLLHHIGNRAGLRAGQRKQLQKAAWLLGKAAS